MISLYGLLMSSVTIGCLAAITLMPIGDLIVLSFTSPVFALIFETLILRRSLKVLSVLFCFLIGKEGRVYLKLTSILKLTQCWVTF